MTARRQHLRATKPGERAKLKRTVAEAAESGDHRVLLVSMRDRVAKAISDQDCPPRDLAALTRRLQEISREIQLLDQRAKEEADSGGVHPDEDWDEAAI